VRGTRGRLLVSGAAVAPKISGGFAEVEIKAVLDHEVLVLE
jgi:hypothetical protein